MLAARQQLDRVEFGNSLPRRPPRRRGRLGSRRTSGACQPLLSLPAAAGPSSVRWPTRRCPAAASCCRRMGPRRCLAPGRDSVSASDRRQPRGASVDRRKTPLPSLGVGCHRHAACRPVVLHAPHALLALHQRHVISLQIPRVQHDGRHWLAHAQRDRHLTAKSGLRGVEVQTQLHARRQNRLRQHGCHALEVEARLRCCRACGQQEQSAQAGYRSNSHAHPMPSWRTTLWPATGPHASAEALGDCCPLRQMLTGR